MIIIEAATIQPSRLEIGAKMNTTKVIEGVVIVTNAHTQTNELARHDYIYTYS